MYYVFFGYKVERIVLSRVIMNKVRFRAKNVIDI